MKGTAVERQLRMLGYSPATQNNRREEIRNLILYTGRGFPVKEPVLEEYLNEMSTDFSNSTPFKKLMRARDELNLNLYKPGDFFYQNDL